MKDSKRGAAVAVQFDDGADPKPVMKVSRDGVFLIMTSVILYMSVKDIVHSL